MAWLATASLVLTAIGGVLLLAFTVAAARNRRIPLAIRITFIVQFVLVVICSILARVTGIDPTGVVFVGVGIALVILASNARAALEDASVVPGATARDARDVNDGR